MTRHRQGVTLSHTDGRRLGRTLRPVALVAVMGTLAAVLSGCSVDWTDVAGFGWPKGITPEAQANYKLWIGTVLASVVVYLMVAGMIFWASLFHRKKPGEDELPRQFGYNMPLELVLTTIPFIIIGILFYFTVVVQEKMVHSDADPEVVVDVTAFQWNWKFGYQKVDYNDGTFSYDGVDEARRQAMVSRPEGVDAHGEPIVGALHGQTPYDRSFMNFDKVETLGTTNEIPVLVVPAGKRIEFVLNSADVVHAFWVPEFLFKRDVIPEPQANNQANTFQVAEITKTGAFVGHCAEMCGTYHAMMNFELRVVSPSDFKYYLNERIAGKSNSEALAAINEAPFATSTHPFDPRRGEQVKDVTN